MPVRQRLTTYLDHRARTWPTSINPYSFLHPRNCGTARHVTPWWIRHQLVDQITDPRTGPVPQPMKPARERTPDRLSRQ